MILILILGGKIKTIMVVDDELNVLNDIKSCLLKEDFEVVTVDNNRKAFEIMDNEDTNFSLILISTRLPNSGIPAFFSMKPESKRNIDTSTEINFLKKPFTKQELLDFVKSRL